MKRNRVNVAILAFLAAGALLIGAAAQAQDSEVTFHWTPSPAVSATGSPLSPAIQYEVFVTKDGGDPELLATVADTTYTLTYVSGVVHRLCVRGLDVYGRASEMSELSAPLYVEVEQQRGEDAPPIAGQLRANYPNPFNPETRIVYGVPENVTDGTPMSLEIYNLAGRRVRVMQVETTPGWHEVLWNGADDAGRAAPTGMYITRFACGDHVETHKMTMLK